MSERLVSDKAREVLQSVLGALADGSSPLLKDTREPVLAPLAALGRSPVLPAIADLLLGGRFNDPRWATFRAITRAGLRVPSGTRGVPVLAFSKGADGEVVLRPYAFFNLSQIPGAAPWVAPPPVPVEAHVARLRQVFAAVGAEVVVAGHEAGYDARRDRILVPDAGGPGNELARGQAALRQLVHWTAAPGRLGRIAGLRDDIDAQVMESFVGYLGAYQLCGRYQVPYRAEGARELVPAWIDLLERGAVTLMQASQRAWAAVQFVLRAAPAVGFDADRVEGSEPEAVVRGTRGAAPMVTPPPAGNEADVRPRVGREAAAPSVARPVVSPLDLRGDFGDFLNGLGLRLEGPPLMDGAFHRAHVLGADGRLRRNAGTYKAYSDGVPNGVAWNHVTGETRRWKASMPALSNKDRWALQQQAAQTRVRQEREIADLHERMAGVAREVYERARPAPHDHPYLAAKGVDAAVGVRIDDSGNLVLPLIDERGEIRSLQRIGPDGRKGFLSKARKAGHFFVIESGSDWRGSPLVLIAEGYATGRTLNLATGHPVVVAFDAGNLKAVALVVRRMRPEAGIVVCGDVDPHGRGQAEARSAAQAVNGRVALPDFERVSTSSRDVRMTDWNDLARVAEMNSVRHQFASSIRNGLGEKIRAVNSDPAIRSRGR